MVTRELVKAEIDKVQDKNLEIIYRIIKAIENPSEPEATLDSPPAAASNWQQFIEATSGSLADDPIKRGDQGQYDIREAIQ